MRSVTASTMRAASIAGTTTGTIAATMRTGTPRTGMCKAT